MNDPFTPQLLSRLPKPPRKIVLLRASRVGDFLCATPAYRALRKALPESEITMITLPMLQDLVMRSPHLDRFVAFPGYPGIAEQFFDARRTICFIQEMQAEHFDLAVQMQGTGAYSNSLMLDATRKWALNRFAAVGIELRRRYSGTVVILGEEEGLATGIALSKQVGAPCLNLMGRTTLTILGAVIARLAVLVTNDTGPAHIAYALGTPTVTIFGAATPERYGPLQNGPYRVLAYPVSCRPCGLATCPIGYTCLEGVTVSQVIEASEQIIRLESLSAP